MSAKTRQFFSFGAFLDGSVAKIDLPKLIKTRMIIEASSGGGKSWLMRKLMEMVFGYVQQIVFDPEGEFASLREKYAFILASAERDEEGKLVGDVEADPNTADALMLTTLKTHASVIIDISELSVPLRQKYVARAVEALVNAPRELWHPVLVWIDEAHDYAAESGHGHGRVVSEEESSLDALRDLASKGRKRGFCIILATQRLAKLSKDVVAELKNYMIGNTNADIDQDRASDILGFAGGKEGQKLKHDLREIEPGIFWASGPIFNSGLKQVKVGKVETHHPEAEESGRVYVPPPTPEEVKPVLEAFAQIPEVKRRKLDELRELRTRDREHLNTIQSLSMKLKNAESKLEQNSQAPSLETIERIEEGSYARGQNDIIAKINPVFLSVKDSFLRIRQDISEIAKFSEELKQRTSRFLEIPIPEMPEKLPLSQVKHPPMAFSVPRSIGKISKEIHRETPMQTFLDPVDDGHLIQGALRILQAVAMFYPNPANISQVSVFSGFSSSGGTWGTYLSSLKKKGFVSQVGETLVATQAGMDRLGNQIPKLPTDPESMYALWSPRLIAGEQKMLRSLMENYPSTMTKEQLGESSGFASSGGTFGTYFSKLKRVNLIEMDPQTGEIRASRFLMGGQA